MPDTPTSQPQPPLDLALYLFARREAILNRWRARCETDDSIQHTSTLSREEFNNEIPGILNLFEQCLRHVPIDHNLAQVASEHGLQRWHKGYTLQELLTELKHFIQCLTDEIASYQAYYPSVGPAVLILAYEQIVRVNNELVEGSVTRYNDLQRKQAAGRADALQETLDHIQELIKQRARLLQMTSHDLRGGFGVIQGAAVLLDRPTSTDQERKKHVLMLQRNLNSVSNMLSQLTDLARLEAGQESLTIETFDASELLYAMVESAQLMAHQRGLTLRADGPAQLLVSTDRVKVQRIVQNLLLNALTYTPSGMVSVSWSVQDNHRWTVGIQDTGPGMPTGLKASLIDPLKPTTDSNSVFTKEESAPLPTGDVPAPAPKAPDHSTTIVSREGIGLYVVKRLSELLNATIDIETKPGNGTLFRVRFPVSHRQ